MHTLRELGLALMIQCGACSAALQPTWKFCIYCGARIAAPAGDRGAVPATAASIRASVAGGRPPAEPRALTALALFGWALGGLLGVLALVAAVLLLTS